jgi:hypothetical protein
MRFAKRMLESSWREGGLELLEVIDDEPEPKKKLPG